MWQAKGVAYNVTMSWDRVAHGVSARLWSATHVPSFERPQKLLSTQNCTSRITTSSTAAAPSAFVARNLSSHTGLRYRLYHINRSMHAPRF